MAEQQQTFVIVGASLAGAGYLTENDDKAKLYLHHEGWYGENSVGCS